jgi:hypothetical protein
MTLFEIAQDLASRLTGTFLRGADGTRPLHGRAAKFTHDPHWKDLVLFYEYFHGDHGAGLGASHQTGWTGLIARIMQLDAALTPKLVLRKNGEHEWWRALQDGNRSRKQESRA